MLAVEKPDPNDGIVCAMALQNLAIKLMRQDQNQLADRHMAEAIDLLRTVVRDHPSVPDFRLRLSGTLMGAAGICSALGEFDRGIKLLEESLELVAFLTTNWPSMRQYHGVHGGALSNLASLLRREGKNLERAERLAVDAIAHQRRAIPSPDKPNDYLLNHYVVLAEIRLQLGRHQDAIAACEEGLRVGEILLAERPKNAVISRNVQRLRTIRETAKRRSPPTDRK